MTAHQIGTLNMDALYVAIDRRRRERRISFRGVCREARISPGTTTRLGRDSQISAENLARLLLWLGETDLKPYLTTEVTL